MYYISTVSFLVFLIDDEQMGRCEVKSCFFRCAGKESEKELPDRDGDIAIAVNANDAEPAVITA